MAWPEVNPTRRRGLSHRLGRCYACNGGSHIEALLFAIYFHRPAVEELKALGKVLRVAQRGLQPRCATRFLKEGLGAPPLRLASRWLQK
jgi:hypothetical protein